MMRQKKYYNIKIRPENSKNELFPTIVWDQVPQLDMLIKEFEWNKLNNQINEIMGFNLLFNDDSSLLLPAHMQPITRIRISSTLLFVSEKIKSILEQFQLLEHKYISIHFLKPIPVKYYLLQLTKKEYDIIDYGHSEFCKWEIGTSRFDDANYSFTDYNDLKQETKKLKEVDLMLTYGPKKIILKRGGFDFYHFMNLGFICSEELKMALEDLGLDAISFEPIDNVEFYVEE